MKVFISWSGLRSRSIAERLHKWLPYIVQPVKPFLSSGDVRKGARWSDALAQELKDTRHGVVCITQQNIMSPWLNFEAGALSKTTGQACVSPVLFGVGPAMLMGPLSQFQATVFEKDGKDMFGLISSINDNLPLELRVAPDILKETFYKWWPCLMADIECAMRTETEETETGLEWLYSVADYASVESRGDWESVWVINPEPLKDWYLLSETFQTNLVRGVRYDFIVPSQQVNVLRELILREVRHHVGDSEDGIDLTNISIGSMDEERYNKQAATHYRVLTSKGERDPHTKVFFEIPVGLCGFWADANRAAVDNFYLRFKAMRKEADPQKVCTLDELQALVDAAAASPGGTGGGGGGQ